MVQRSQGLSAKKWYVRDNPQATGYTLDALRGMSAKALAKNMVGYTAKIPGTRASKAQLRRVILTMVRQIEIETAAVDGGEDTNMKPGDVPSLFGTLTTQRYYWDDIIRIIAVIEGINDHKQLSKSKRRQLVNKYPLFVEWYCTVRLELILKTVVVPMALVRMSPSSSGAPQAAWCTCIISCLKEEPLASICRPKPCLNKLKRCARLVS